MEKNKFAKRLSDALDEIVKKRALWKKGEISDEALIKSFKDFEFWLGAELMFQSMEERREIPKVALNQTEISEFLFEQGKKYGKNENS